MNTMIKKIIRKVKGCLRRQRTGGRKVNDRAVRDTTETKLRTLVTGHAERDEIVATVN